MKENILLALLILNGFCLWFFTGPYYAHAATLLSLTNQERSMPLKTSAVVTARAQSRALYLCWTNTFSHTYWQAWLEDLGYSRYGENLAKGFPSNEATNRALMASPTHRANITNASYRYVGFGRACGITVELFVG